VGICRTVSLLNTRQETDNLPVDDHGFLLDHLPGGAARQVR
jgi:hypothetical protein